MYGQAWMMCSNPASLKMFNTIDNKGFDRDPSAIEHPSITGAFKTWRYVVMYL